MKTSTIITALLFSVFIGGCVTAVIKSLPTSRPAQTLGEASLPFNTGTNTYVDCGSSSTQVVATSSSRQDLILVNDASSTQIYLGMAAAAVGSNGIRLNASGGTYETMAGQNVFTGAIYCIASTTARLTVFQN